MTSPPRDSAGNLEQIPRSSPAQRAVEAIAELLAPEIADVPAAFAKPPATDNPYLVLIPEDLVDYTLEEIGSIVARTSNAYTRAARADGIAQAILTGAKGKFDRKYKTHRTGRSDAERDKAAMEACADEHAEYLAAEQIVALTTRWEKQARVASETARKIFGNAGNMATGEQRGSVGQVHEKDYDQW